MAPKAVPHFISKHPYADPLLAIVAVYGSALLDRCEQRGAGEQKQEIVILQKEETMYGGKPKRI